MDFSYSEEQESLKSLAARLFATRFTDEFRKQFRRSGEPYDSMLWAQLANAGLLGTTLAPEHGGSGLGFTELCLLLEEQGRTLASVPLFATLVLGALPLQRFGTPAQQALLRGVAAGEIILSAALEEPGATNPLSPGTLAQAVSGGFRLTGLKSCVPFGAQSHRVLVAAHTAEHGARLFILDPKAPGVALESERSTSGEPQAQIKLTDVAVAATDVLGESTEIDPLRWTLDRAHVAVAARQLGVTSEALRRAAAYATGRRQFGRPIGSFQAVQHRLADCYIDVEALRSAYLRAVWTLEEALPASAEVLAAKWWAAQAGHRVTHAVQHIHGGLGADVEYPIHAFFLEAKQLEMALGGATAFLAAIGAELATGRVRSFT